MDITVTERGVLGTADRVDESLVLYPNAVRDVLHLSVAADILRLYSTDGRLLLTYFGVQKVSMYDLASGRYIVEVVRHNRSARFVIVKE